MAESGIVTSAYEVVVQQLATRRPPLQNLDRQLFPCGGPKPKALIEISGLSNSGKTVLLSWIMARCLPPTYFGGKNSDILFINMGHKFSIANFKKYIERIILESKEQYTAAECRTIVDNSLDSVIMLNCFSSDEFHLTVDCLEDILLKNQYVNLIAIDELDAFYWQDAYKKLLKMSTHYAKIFKKLRALCESYNICCVYTVNSNYIKFRPNDMDASHPLMLYPDYIFKLTDQFDGTKLLNDRIITIDDNGINFIT